MKKLFSLIAVAAAIVLAGCNQDNSGTSSGNTATSSASMTNTPAGTNAATGGAQ